MSDADSILQISGTLSRARRRRPAIESRAVVNSTDRGESNLSVDVRSLLLTVMAWSLSSTALAQPSASPVSSIRVTGSATLHAKPDRVEIDIGVVTHNSQAAPAAAENARQLEAVLAALHRAVGNEVDIKTVSYSLTPDYHYQSGTAPEITGYTAGNIVHVTLDDLQKIGTVIDAVTRTGANRVQDVEFTLRDPETAHLQALREAARNARSEADALASSLGVKISRVLSAEEGGGSVTVRPVWRGVARAEVAPEHTPIEAGTLDVSATVTLTVAVDG